MDSIVLVVPAGFQPRLLPWILLREETAPVSIFSAGWKALYLFCESTERESGIYIGSLDSQEKSFLLHSDRSAVFSSGYLLFQRVNTLFAQAFDVKKLKFSGEAIPLSENVWYEPEHGEPAEWLSQTIIFSLTSKAITCHNCCGLIATGIN